jgi:hypothetical protein
MFDDSYEFEIPEELRPWLEYQRDQWQSSISTYILDRGKITKKDFLESCLWWSEHPDAWRVDSTEIGEARVSTVFLHIDHNFWTHYESRFAEIPKGVEMRPILFETMIFGGEFDQYQCRYCTLAEAKKGHWNVVDGVKNGTLF